MISDIIGAGVLSLAGGVVQVGWFWGLTLVILAFPINFYTACLISRVRTAYPESVTMMYFLINFIFF